ncbi:MAG: sulfurtransferase TusA family protein [Verrucomicrobia bacterium]|nr:sulfurtransferase TusA family protein [Verrucomicrobiota bacterium]
MTQPIDRTLDCSGLSCPMPIVKTSKAIKEIQISQVLKVIATDSGSPKDMEAWTRQTGQELISSTEESGKYIFLIRRLK